MDTDTPVALPRLDAHPEYHLRAWLFPYEANILDACECPDIVTNLTLAVRLLEHQGKRKRGGRLKLTDEQRAREDAAGEFFRPLQTGMYSTWRMLQMIANLRRDLYYAKRGEQAPPVPEPEPSPAVVAP